MCQYRQRYRNARAQGRFQRVVNFARIKPVFPLKKVADDSTFIGSGRAIWAAFCQAESDIPGSVCSHSSLEEARNRLHDPGFGWWLEGF